MRADLGPPRMRGFTLIELMVMLVLLATLVSLAAPSFGSRLAQHRLRAAAEGLSLDLAQARYRAAQEGRTTFVSFVAGADWCYAVAAVPGCGCGEALACQLKAVRATELPGVALLSSTDATFDAAGTNGTGTPGTTGGGAEFGSREGQVLRVGVTALGRARICAVRNSPDYPAC